MSFLPRFFTMQTGQINPYLSVDETSASPASGKRLQFVESIFTNPRVKFAFEQSTSGSRTLVHIRSCHNNRYLVAHDVDGQVVFSASAEDPVEDPKDPACTLFRCEGSWVFDDAWLGTIVCISRNMFLRELRRTLTVDNRARNFWLVDLEQRLILPSQVTFQSDQLKDHHLVPRVLDKNKNYLRFETGRDMGEVLVAHELVPTLDAYYQIRSVHLGRTWEQTGSKGNPYWILAKSTYPPLYDAAKFMFVKQSDNILALRSWSRRSFCGPLSAEKKKNCLSAQYPTLTRETRLIVQERVLERTISDIRYRFDDSRVYQRELQEVTHAIATNDTHLVDEMALSFEIEESKTTSWKNSISVYLGVKTTLKVTLVPVIVTGKVESSAEFNYEYEWAKTETKKSKRKLDYKVTVPPFSKRKVTLVCTNASCDVPYSYRQTDLLPDGKRVSVIKDDGIFFGVNSYNFDVQSTMATEDALGRMYL